MIDHSFEMKERLLREIGFYTKNNFCNLTGVNYDIKYFKGKNMEVDFDGYWLTYKRPVKDFFLIGANYSKYTDILFPIGRYYLALEREGKVGKYTFEEYVKNNLKDTYDDLQFFVREETPVKEFRIVERKVINTEEVWKTEYLNRTIVGDNKELIEKEVAELIDKHYPNLDDDDRTMAEFYLNDEFDELKFGKYCDYFSYDYREGYYYLVYEDYDREDYALIDYAVAKEDYDKFIKEHKDTLDYINKEIDKIVEKYYIEDDYIEVEDTVYDSYPIYSDEEVINFIKRHKLWDREFLSKFYQDLSEEDVNNLIKYYNEDIWKNYVSEDEYYYNGRSRHLEKKFGSPICMCYN